MEPQGDAGRRPEWDWLRGDRTGPEERWRPADKPIVKDRRRGDVRATLDLRRARPLGRRKRRRGRCYNQKPPGTQITVQRGQARSVGCPDRSLRRVDISTVTGPIGRRGLLGRVVHLVKDWSSDAPRGKGHEQQPGRNGAKSLHGPSRASKQDQSAN